MSKSWYVVQTKPQKEVSVFKLLCNGGFEAFLPKIKTFFQRSRNGSGSVLDRIKPLFPSYLFVRLPLNDFNEFRTVKYTRGVHKLVGNPEGPIPITETIITIIRNRIGEQGYIEQGHFLKPKDRVVVKRGVLKDLIGILEKPMDDRGRVEVLFKIVHHQMHAKVFCGDLEKID